MKWSRFFALGLALSAAYIVTMGSSSVGAVSGSGYFTGRGINVDPISVSRNDVLSGSSIVNGSRSGFAVPAMSTKQQVYNWLRSEYANSAANSRDQIGVTFIVKTMIGVPAGTSGRPVSKTLTNADWAELNLRLVQNPNIRVRNITGNPNGYGDGRISFYGGGGAGNTGGETFYASYSKSNVPLLIIEDIASNTRYVLERYCANPVGSLSLPPYEDDSWSATSESRLHTPGMPGSNGQWGDARNRPTQTVQVGQPITFWHRLNNTGTKDITGNFTTYVQSYRQATPNPSGTQVSTAHPDNDYGDSWNTTLMQSKEIAAGGFVYFHPTYTGDRGAAVLSRTAVTADVGSFVCQRIATLSEEGDNSTWQYSAPACVRVVAAPPPPPWNVGGTSSRTVNGVSTGTGAPNQTIRWTHTLRLNGSVSTAPITSNVNITGFSNGWNASHYNSTTIASGRPVGVIRTITSSPTNRTQYVITQNDVGNTLCQQIRWAPTSNTIGTTSAATRACVEVPYNYNLNPIVSTDIGSGSTVDPGSSVDVSPRVNNVGPTKSRNTRWVLTEMVIPRGGDIPGARNDNRDPCTYFMDVSADSCSDSLPGGSDSNVVFDINPNPTVLEDVSRTIPDNLSVGDRICWALSVTPRSHNSSQWQHSAPYCLTVGKRPKVQFWGGDVRSKEGVMTNQSVVNNNIYGSWAEYAIFSGDLVVSSSGAGLAGEGGVPEPPLAGDYNRLTFANILPSLGHFSTTIPDPVVPVHFTSSECTTTPGGGPISLGGQSGVLCHEGTLNIGNNSNSVSGSMVIRAETVNISGDIIYADGNFNIDRLPQVVIVADRIIISPAVEQVDAWLVARNGGEGYISTCGTVSSGDWLAGLRANGEGCDEHQLRINGPVIADHLYLRRTFGGENPNLAEPAEILNMRPDAYLWLFDASREPGAISTGQVVDKPPRL